MGKNMYRTLFIYDQHWLLSIEESWDWKEAYGPGGGGTKPLIPALGNRGK